MKHIRESLPQITFEMCLGAYFEHFSVHRQKWISSSAPLVNSTPQTHPYTVFLSVLSPVVPCVAEHEQVGHQPIRATVAALRSYSCDLGPPSQVHLQPLVPVRGQGWPAASSLREREREREYDKQLSKHSVASWGMSSMRWALWSSVYTQVIQMFMYTNQNLP